MSDSEHFPELAAKLQAIRERIRLRVNSVPPPLPAAPAPLLQPIDGKLDVSQSQATAIGTVNPRPEGLGNELVQSLKRTLARITDWQLRPQRDFNLAVVDSLAKTTAAVEVLGKNLGVIQRALEERDQLLRHSLEARDQKQREFSGELDALCEQITLQRWSYEGALMRQKSSLEQLQKRVATQAKAQATRPDGVAPAPLGAPPAAPLPLDYCQLERQFRGTEEEIRKRQSFYLPFFSGRRQVLDVACGRGEFLELMRDSNNCARGIDLDADMVGRCLEKGLDAVQTDVFAYLEGLPDSSLDGIFSSQFVEHLEPPAYLRLIALCATKLASGGVLALETQNPECLAIFSQSFYLDPTHVRPIPPALLRFALIETGLERVTTHSLSPAAAALPLIPPLPAGAMEPAALHAYNLAVAKFNETFFGGMDYAAIGYKPSASV